HGKRITRSNNDARARGIQSQNEQRFTLAGKTKAFALADGEMDHAFVAAEYAAILVHDVALPYRFRLQLFHDPVITAFRHKTDVLAVGLVGNRQAKSRGDGAHVALFHAAERKAEKGELFRLRGKQKIALIARFIGGAVQL